ncbi:MAG: hypothetical protein WBK55_08690 [Alphaproteobacteria bacterium]
MSEASIIGNPPDGIAGIYNFPEGLRVVIAQPNYYIVGSKKAALGVDVSAFDAEELAKRASSLGRLIEYIEKYSSDAPFIDVYRQNAQTVEDAKLALQRADANPQSFPTWNDDVLSVAKIIKNLYPEYDPAAQEKNKLWQVQVDDAFAEGNFADNQATIKRYEERIKELALLYGPALA